MNQSIAHMDDDDSNMFFQWAMNQLQRQHSTSAAAADDGAPAAYPNGGAGDGESAFFPLIQALRDSSQSQTSVCVVRDLAVQVVDHGGTNSNSWSSGNNSPGGATMNCDGAAGGWSSHRTIGLESGGNSSNKPVSWNFSAAATAAQPAARGCDVALTDDGAATAVRAPQHASTGVRGGRNSAAPPAASSSPRPVQDHIIAERRRREKINQRFIELSTVIPGLKKMDKATILGDAVKYVRELQDKVKTLEKDGVHHRAGSTIHVKKQCRMPDNDGAAAASGGMQQQPEQLPEIEARVSDETVLLRIYCDNARGLLVKVLSEVEKMNLAIAHTNVMPFPASTAIITITAKMEEGFNVTVDEIVRRINSVLQTNTLQQY